MADVVHASQDAAAVGFQQADLLHRVHLLVNEVLRDIEPLQQAAGSFHKFRQYLPRLAPLTLHKDCDVGVHIKKDHHRLSPERQGFYVGIPLAKPSV